MSGEPLVSTDDEQRFLAMCPEFGKDCDLSDEQCQACEVQQRCLALQKKREREKPMAKQGTQAAAMNECLAQGMTLADIATRVGVTSTRVKGHINHLRKKRGLTIVETNGIYKIEETEDS